MSEQTTAPTERDELADLIAAAVEDHIYNAGDVPPSLTPMVASAAADAVLAAGYRKPRTVTTVEELDALVGGTIIRTVKSKHNPHGLCFEKYGKEWLALDPADREDGETTIPSGAVLRFYWAHSITVLFTPEATS